MPKQMWSPARSKLKARFGTCRRIDYSICLRYLFPRSSHLDIISRRLSLTYVNVNH